MKKCPFCAEKIQTKATVCKHCHKEQPTKPTFTDKLNEQAKIAQEKEAAKLANMTDEERKEYQANKTYQNTIAILWFAVLIFVYLTWTEYGLWAILPIIIGVWFTPKKKEKLLKNRFKDFKKEKVRSGISIALIVIMLVGLTGSYLQTRKINIAREKVAAEKQVIKEYPEPVITIISSQEDVRDALTYLLEFKVEEAENVYLDKEELEEIDGKYTKEIELRKPITSISIKAENKHKTESESFSIKRNQTPDEIAEEEKEEKLRLERLEADIKEEELERMESNPEQFIDITSNDWYVGGFGIAAIHTITIKNTAEVNYKNIDLYATYYANSGDLLHYINHTILDVLPAGTSKTFWEQNLGYIPDQVAKSRIEVVGATTY